jgi:hypothetical protein
MENNVIKEYGTTNVPESAWFITTKGKLLDTSWKTQWAFGEWRNVDHRELAMVWLWDSAPKWMDGSEALIKYQELTKNIRVDAWWDYVLVDTAYMPNPSQFNAIQRLGRWKNWYTVDITDPVTWLVKKSWEFTSMAKLRKFVEDYFS